MGAIGNGGVDMTKVITYGTYDLLHRGHIRLLERAKQLGDYLIVGVTADDFDKKRGKINVQQPLMERVEAVRATGIADEIIIEEYEGQKIDDIRKYDIDVFTVGSDWAGKFDYLNEYCKVVYLERTQGISSSDKREQKRAVKLGLIGDGLFLNKIVTEARFVNGIQIDAVCSKRIEVKEQIDCSVDSIEALLDKVEAVYIRSLPSEHYAHIKKAINAGKHVLCESPIALTKKQNEELFKMAKEKNVILMEAIKTAYATAFSRLVLMIKSGKIGDVVSVDATCTSLRKNQSDWSGVYEWGPTALLPVFQLLGTDVRESKIVSHLKNGYEDFTKIEFVFSNAVASIKVGDGVKSEGELVVSGTKGYIYVPAPWWKTDYFEIRYEDPSLNKRCFYQLDGEGIRYELVAFARAIECGKVVSNISEEVSYAISDVMDALVTKKNVMFI